MKFCKVGLFFALLVAVCLPAMAQTTMRVNVPFNFIAAGKSLPAGQYIVGPVASFTCAWSLSSDHTSAMIITNPADFTAKAHRPSLVFMNAGGAYSLVEIWNSHSGRNVPQSNVKRTLVSKDESKGDKYVEVAAE
jgi:hypothetical protein